MKNPKVGERVARYDSESVRNTGKIEMVSANGICLVDFETHNGYFHRTQLIRLKPRKNPMATVFPNTTFEDVEFKPQQFRIAFKAAYISLKPFVGKKCRVTVEVIE